MTASTRPISEEASPVRLSDVERRCEIAKLVPTGHEDADELLFWLLTGRPQNLTPSTDLPIADHEARLLALTFVVEHAGLGPFLGLSPSPVAILGEIERWLTAPAILPLPRHYKVVVLGAFNTARPGAGPARVMGKEATSVRVRNRPTSDCLAHWPDDAL